MRFIFAFLLLASTAVAQTATQSYTGVPVARYAALPVSLAMDASGEDVAYVVSIPKTGTITKIGLRLGTVTEEDTLSVAIQTLGTDGKPSGSNYGSSTAGTVAFADTDDNTSQEVTLGTSASAVAGNLVAVVISWNSYTDGNLQINNGGSGGGNTNSLAAVYHDSGAGFSRVTSAIPMLYLYYSDSGGEYRIPFGCLPPCNINYISFQSDTSPDEVAMKFTAPFAMRVTGTMWGFLWEQGSTAEVNFDLFSDAGTPLSLLTNPTVVTHDAIPLASTTYFGMEPESMSSGQSAYFSIFSEDATNDFSVTYMDVANTAHWGDFMPHIGWASRTRTSDGSPNGGPGWTDLSTRKPIGGVLFDQVTAGSNTIDPLTGTIPGL